MNENDATHFRALIAAQLAELAEDSKLGASSQSVVTLDQQAVGRLSRMDALQSQAMAKAQQVRRDVKATALGAALERIDADEFGWCEACGEDIPRKRLEFDPAVVKCIGCASA